MLAQYGLIIVIVIVLFGGQLLGSLIVGVARLLLGI
jgi:hypothetical protein